MKTQPLRDHNAVKRKQFLSLVMRRVRPGTGSSLDFLNRRSFQQQMFNLAAIIQRTPFVVVGGIATRLYMSERFTFNLDILVLTPSVLQLSQELKEAGCIRVGELSIPGSQWELPDGSSLDVIESEDNWVIQALASPNPAPDGLPYIALPYLVLMKLQASRTQDLADISRMLGGTDEVSLQEVRSVIQSYLPSATEDLESLIMLGKLERRADNV